MVSRGERPGLGLAFKQHHAPRLCVLHRLINSAMRFNLRSLRINAKLEDVVGVLLAHTMRLSEWRWTGASHARNIRVEKYSSAARERVDRRGKQVRLHLRQFACN